jgi:hypothetical protein
MREVVAVLQEPFTNRILQKIMREQFHCSYHSRMRNAAKGCAIIVCLLFIGCGGLPQDPSCAITAIHISPATATADHTAASPGNAQHFDAFETNASNGCMFQASALQHATWTLSDAVNAEIGNQQNVNYGTATCINAAPAPITVTATVPTGNGSNVSATATLTCN